MTDILESSPTVNLDAERLLLGALLQGWTDLDDLHVTGSDFYQPIHETVFAAIVDVIRSGQRPDINSVRLAIGPTLHREDTGLFLFDLTQGVVAPQAPHYARAVSRAADLRGLALASIRIQQLANTDGDDDPATLIEQARSLLDRSPRREGNAAELFADSMAALMDRVEKGVEHGLTTPWPDLDEAITGLHPGGLYIVAGRPKSGKSIVGAGIATHIARHHKKAALVASMEMSRLEYEMRVVADLGSINLTQMLKGTKDDRVHQRIAATYQRFGRAPLFIDDTPGQTVTHIRSRARSIGRKHELGVIVADYAQLMLATNPKANRQEQVSLISRSMKMLAKEQQVPVVLLAQLNRGPEQRQDKKPVPSDLRESGSLEQDADAVILLWNDEAKLGERQMIVGNNRHGPQCEFPLMFAGHYARLTSPGFTGSMG